jgi:hypothetical protein
MLNVKISFRREKTRSTTEDTRFGVAEPYDRGGVEAILYYQHIDTFASSGSASRSLVLAHALAHEVGHLLLWSNSHSPGGIMKASWNRSDLMAIEQGKLAFSFEEAQRMKANLSRRQMQYQLIMASDGSVRKHMLTDPSHARISKATNPEVTLLVYNYADVSPEVLAKAEERAAIIFQEVGARVIWVDSADFKRQFHSDSQKEREELDSIDVFLRIVPHSRAALRSSALGEALPCEMGKDACIVNIFMNRVGEHTDVEKIGLDQVLGHAMAHEIGHILLGSNSHNSNGLMKSKWGPEDMKQAAKGDLLFTPEQAQTIRKNLTKRARTNLFGSTTSTPAKATETNLKINVCVYNLASVPWGTLAQAEKEAGKIFERTGVQLSWLDYPLGGHEVVESSQACGPPFGAADVRLRLLTYRLTELRETHPHSLGLALPCAEADGGCFVNVFYQRTQELAKDADLGLAKVLGHTIAHEIGHLLLGSKAHSPDGLMRAKWGPKDLHRAGRGDLLFGAEETTIIRAQVVARMRRMP